MREGVSLLHVVLRTRQRRRRHKSPEKDTITKWKGTVRLAVNSSVRRSVAKVSLSRLPSRPAAAEVASWLSEHMGRREDSAVGV